MPRWWFSRMKPQGRSQGVEVEVMLEVVCKREDHGSDISNVTCERRTGPLASEPSIICMLSIWR